MTPGNSINLVVSCASSSPHLLLHLCFQVSMCFLVTKHCLSPWPFPSGPELLGRLGISHGAPCISYFLWVPRAIRSCGVSRTEHWFSLVWHFWCRPFVLKAFFGFWFFLLWLDTLSRTYTPIPREIWVPDQRNLLRDCRTSHVMSPNPSECTTYISCTVTQSSPYEL